MKDLSTKQKIGIVLTFTAYLASIILPIAEYYFCHTIFSLVGVISMILEEIATNLRKQYHRGDELSKIFEDATIQEKDEIYNFVKKYEKK